MNKTLASALLLALNACATEETHNQDLEIAAAACEPHTHTLTSSGNSLFIDGDLFATITCSDYVDPRIDGTPAELGAFVDEKCSIQYGAVSHNTGCDAIDSPVTVDPTTGVVTVTRCVDACSGDTYTAEGGSWVDVPVETGAYDYLCDLEGTWAGCCDFFGVKPDVLASCDRYYEYADGGWQEVSTASGTPTSASTSIARGAPTTTTPLSTDVDAGLDGMINSVKNVILSAGVITHMMVPHGEVKEKLGQMLEQAQHMLEQKEKLKPVPVPGPVPKGPLNPPGTTPPPPRAGGILVPPRPPTQPPPPGTRPPMPRPTTPPPPTTTPPKPPATPPKK